MLIIDSSAAMARALDSPIAVRVKRLLTLRRDQLLDECEHDLGELGRWIIVQSGDTLGEIETAIKFPIAPDPSWEWVLDHGGMLEAPIITSDDGYGSVLIVPDEEGIDRTLMTWLRRDAVAADASGNPAPSTYTERS